jgi:hypothetical protein
MACGVDLISGGDSVYYEKFSLLLVFNNNYSLESQQGLGTRRIDLLRNWLDGISPHSAEMWT